MKKTADKDATVFDTEPIREALNKFNALLSSREELANMEQKVKDELDLYFKTHDPADPESLNLLSSKKTQLEIIPHQLVRIENGLAALRPILEGELHMEMRIFIINTATAEAKDLEEKITNFLKPFYSNVNASLITQTINHVQAIPWLKNIMQVYSLDINAAHGGRTSCERMLNLLDDYNKHGSILKVMQNRWSEI